MAMRLLNAGYALTAWNRTRAKEDERAAFNAQVAQGIRRGFAESRILEVRGQRMPGRNFMSGGRVKSQVKDLENVLAAAAAGRLGLPVTQLLSNLYRSILDAPPNADQAAALLAIEKLNSGIRIHQAPDKLP